MRRTLLARGGGECSCSYDPLARTVDSSSRVKWTRQCRRVTLARTLSCSPAPTLSTRQTALPTVPKHVAIIMDGSSRWAKARGLDAMFGHEAGVAALQRTVAAATSHGIRALTVYAFSRDNWRRGAREVSFLMSLFGRAIDEQMDELAAQGVRLRFIGDREGLPLELQARMRRSEAATRDGSSLQLTVALNYSAREDVAAAARAVARLVAAGKLDPQEVTPEVLQAHLSTGELVSSLGPPDLLVRTSGENRLSDFLLFESAYCELYFTSVLWPEFGEAHLLEALAEYARRERRYGRRSRA